MIQWRKAGWRSALHKGYPKFVVRFNQAGRGIGKLLMNRKEFDQQEIAAGRNAQETFNALVKSAEQAWPELNKQQQDTERKNEQTKENTTDKSGNPSNP